MSGFWSMFGSSFEQFDNRTVTAEQLKAYDERNVSLAQYYGYDQQNRNQQLLQQQDALGQQSALMQNSLAQQASSVDTENLRQAQMQQLGWSRSQFEQVLQGAAALAKAPTTKKKPEPEIELNPVRLVILTDDR